MATTKKHLIIVESPSKAKTIGKFLGSRYKVIASAGHVRDLPKSRMGIDFDNKYEPEYINVRGKGDVIKAIKQEAKKADRVYLATDPDREGEAIAWHICNILDIAPEEANRIEFHEITKTGVKTGLDNKRPINMSLVDAQQGRRVMDRVVGYSISPVLWKKVQRGLSAGRVQSSALKMICDREKEIRDFIPEEYWTIEANLSKEKSKFIAKLSEYKDKKIEIKNKEESDAILKDLDAAKYIVSNVEEKQRKRNPYAPYTTSTLQQDASVKLGFTSKKTMSIAQKLYEGCEVKGYGVIGLVSYIRTDSVRISAEADAAVKAYIKDNFGEDMIGNTIFVNKNKGTQDAHEAIRPSNINITPDLAAASLSVDELKLYKLIWSRFVASRMKAAIYDTSSAVIKAGDYNFKATGSRINYEGFLKVYKDSSKEEKDKYLPDLKVGDELKLSALKPEQKFTEPPARFTEASLIKELEEKGIGRPSTYAPIVSTLQERGYITKEKKSVIPTERGMLVTKEIMEVYFPEVVDIGFTSNMEENLDKVANGQAEWKTVVSDYYNGNLKVEIDNAKEQMEKIKPTVQLTEELCPECGKPLALRHGKFGDFLACSGFPDCRFTKSIITTTGVKCPKCGGDIIVKRSKKGKIFYGCSSYPECETVFWYKPVNKTCPQCGNLLVERGKMLYCSDQNCEYREKK